MMQELTCQELVELITDYLEETLPSSERQRFEAHLQDCQGCRIYLQQMRQTLSLVGNLNEDSLAPEVQQDLLQLFRTWKTKHQ